ncbi:Eugenol O-methyltransferase [Acorus calamus]|uniref:Eugenol O-methyltransferase n=1 Tax=Acorus calamus TaxID=4465 RepID=A0AAV9FKH9_ACOCL|nr:Eugenol O-methyltransferase [Acorus calamus]
MAQPTADNVEEEQQAQVLVWNHIFQFISSMSLKSVVELGIPDVLHRNEGRPIPPTGLTTYAASCACWSSQAASKMYPKKEKKRSTY